MTPHSHPQATVHDEPEAGAAGPNAAAAHADHEEPAVAARAEEPPPAADVAQPGNSTQTT